MFVDPGHEATANNRTTTMSSITQPSLSNPQPSINRHQSNNVHFSEKYVTIFLFFTFSFLTLLLISIHSQQDLQVRRWKTAYGQYRICYIGDLPDDFLRVKFLSKSEIHNQSKVNNYFNNYSLYSHYFL